MCKKIIHKLMCIKTTHDLIVKMICELILQIIHAEFYIKVILELKCEGIHELSVK